MTLNISESCSEGIRCSVFLSFISPFLVHFPLLSQVEKGQLLWYVKHFTFELNNTLNASLTKYISHQIEAMLSGNHSIDVTTVITQFVTLTRPGNEQRLNAKELSTSVNILELLVTYNSLQNNGAFTKPADRRNILVAGSNLLDEENTQTWLQLQRVLRLKIDVTFKH